MVQKTVIYIDEVFFVNALVDLLLLLTADSITGCGTRRWRLWAGAGFGGLAAAAVFLPGLGWLGRLPGAVLTYAGLCGIAFGLRGRGRWKQWLWFFCVCCGFAGLSLAVCGLLRLPAFGRDGRVYYRLPGRLLALLAGAVYGLCRLLLDRFARHRGGELIRLRLELDGRSVTCAALRDSGNTLCDPMTGQPVLVARWQLAHRLLPGLGLTADRFRDPAGLMTLLSAVAPGLQTRLIPYRAVGVEGGLLCAVRMDRILEDGKPSPARLVAFTAEEISDGGAYDALAQS